MNTGIGFSEMLLVLFVVVLFFGSKELPRFVREIMSLVAKARRYSDRVRKELDELSRPIQDAATSAQSSPQKETAFQKKRKIRESLQEKLRAMSEVERMEKSRAACEHLKATDAYRNAPAVMVYVSKDDEVDTRDFIREMLTEGKRVIVPYCKDGSRELGIAQIEDLVKDLQTGKYGILEPVHDKRDNFFRSDLKLIICPGVAFDKDGGRVGRGKGCYDSFMAEINGRIPVYGLAFDVQVLDAPVPFDYHDVPVDQVVTESGLVAKALLEEVNASPSDDDEDASRDEGGAISVQGEGA